MDKCYLYNGKLNKAKEKFKTSLIDIGCVSNYVILVGAHCKSLFDQLFHNGTIPFQFSRISILPFPLPFLFGEIQSKAEECPVFLLLLASL